MKSIQVRFSQESAYVATFSERNLKIYDMMQVAEENDTDCVKLLKHMEDIEFKMDVTFAYDKIHEVFIDEEDVLDTWLVLTSQEFSFIHIIQLRDLLHEIKEQKIYKNHLGGTFYNSLEDGAVMNDVRIQIIDEKVIKEWDIKILFSEDGSRVVINTSGETYVAMLDPENQNVFTYVSIPYLKDKLVTEFRRGQNDVLFCERQEDKQKIVFSCIQIEESKCFSNSKFKISGSIQVVEALEFEQDDKKIFRIIAIRENEEVMIFQLEKDSKSVINFRSVNSSKLNSFRWPFFAYVHGESSLIINPLAIKDEKGQQTNLHLNITYDQFEDQSFRITHCEFTKKGNLYVLSQSEKWKIFYRIKVANHCGRNNFQRYWELDDEQRQNIQEKLANGGPLVEQVYSYIASGSQQGIYRFQVVEEDIGFTETVTFLVQIGQSLQIIQCPETGDAVKTTFKYPIHSLTPLSKNTFITRGMDKEEFRLIHVRYQGNKVFTEKLVHTEFTAKVIRILADRGQVYLLRKKHMSYSLKIFQLAVNDDDLEYVNTIYELEETNPTFIDAFRKNVQISSNILIHSDCKASKIYHGSEKIKPSIQELYNFWPEEIDKKGKDRQMLLLQSNPCKKNRRLSIVFNYPQNFQAKQTFLMPYFSDNQISISRRDKQACWISTNQDLNNINVSLMTLMQPMEAQKCNARIFQFKPEKWKLLEYDLSGLQTKATSFDKDFEGNQILCNSDSSPVYLLSPLGVDYLKILKVVQITEQHECKEITKVNTKEIQVDSDDTFNSLYDMLKYHRSAYKCEFIFDVNKNGVIAIASVLKSGNIIDIHIVRKIEGDKYQASQIQVEQEEQVREKKKKVKTAKSVFSPLTRLAVPQQMSVGDQKRLENKAFAFRYCSKFILTDENLIAWSKKVILSGTLSEKKETQELQNDEQDTQIDLQQPKYVTLKPISFQLHAQSNKQDKKKKKKGAELFKKKTTISEKLEDNELELDDYIESVYCRDVDFSATGGTIIQIKIVTSLKDSHIVSYNISREREIQWMTSTRDCDLFFDQDGDALILDQINGMTAINSQNNYFEYHVADRNRDFINLNKLAYGTSWGQRFVRTNTGNFLIFASSLIMPFSYISVVQHFQEEKVDALVDQYYIDDYYKIEGQTPLNKQMYNPDKLEKIIDCYFEQNPNFITTVLVKEELAHQEIDAFGRASLKKLQATSSRKSIFESGVKLDDQPPTFSFDAGSVVEIDGSGSITKIVYGQDPLDAQLEMSCDRLVNKMLYYLSQVSIQKSFFNLIPRFSELVEYSRFEGYMDNFFQMTKQMEETTVLYTDKPAGPHLLTFDQSYLDKKFFDENPVRPSVDENSTQSTIITDQFPGEQENKEEEQEDDEDKPFLQQVIIKGMYISWVTKTKESLEFLEALVNHENVKIFNNKNLRLIITYLWRIARPYFIYWVFIPFLCLGYIPVHIVALTDLLVEYPTIRGITDALGGLSLLLYFVFKTLSELAEMKQQGIDYFKDWFNYIEILVQGLIITFFILTIQLIIENDAQDDEQLRRWLRVVNIAQISLMNFQLFYLIRIFDFFAAFVRQLVEIMNDMLPIGSVLLFVVCAQGLLFYVLDIDMEEPAFYGKSDLSGIGSLFINSYRLTLGDFEITEAAFDGATILHWLLFVMGAIISLLVLLNMVIAVMSATFERVEEDREAILWREKLIAILGKYHMFPQSLRQEFSQSKYLLQIEVDPEVDPIPEDTPEHRIKTMIHTLKEDFKGMKVEQDSIFGHVSSLHDKISRFDHLFDSKFDTKVLKKITML